MQQSYTNIYKRARARAGLTQEQAAELLALSVESVKAYETGIRVPPAAAVAVMAEAYGSPGLLLEHAKATDELGLIPEAVRPRSLEQLTLRFYHLLREAFRLEPRLQEIAEDGMVDESEADDYARIQAFIGEEFAAACLELRCCEGAKRERPDGGTSKRSVDVDVPFTQTTNLLYQKGRKSQEKTLPERRWT